MKMIKNQITRSDAQRFVDMQNNVNAIILSPATYMSMEYKKQ